eukprot:4402785-Pleurochrysis_carterae.AAC.2
MPGGYTKRHIWIFACNIASLCRCALQVTTLHASAAVRVVRSLQHGWPESDVSNRIADSSGII